MLIRAQSTGAEAVDSALISAVVAFAVAALTQFALSVRDGRSRRYERRRAALLDLQTAALNLRQRVREYGLATRQHPGQPSPALTEAEQHFDDAHSAFEVSVSRVEDRRVLKAVQTWSQQAQISFVSVQDVPASTEQASWQAMNAAIGQALKSKTGATPD